MTRPVHYFVFSANEIPDASFVGESGESGVFLEPPGFLEQLAHKVEVVFSIIAKGSAKVFVSSAALALLEEHDPQVCSMIRKYAPLETVVVGAGVLSIVSVGISGISRLFADKFHDRRLAEFSCEYAARYGSSDVTLVRLQKE